MNLQNLVPVLALALSTACTRSAPPPQAASPATVHVVDNVRTPLVVKWVSPELTANTLRITARIERRTQFAAPLTITLGAPSTAKVESGPSTFQIAAGAPAGVDERILVLRFDSVPAEDLQLVADIQTGSFGAHATDVYRFGRPAPQVVPVRRDGPEVQVGGQNLGRAVMMPAPEPAPSK